MKIRLALLYFVAVLALFFTSCNNDDAPANTTQDTAAVSVEFAHKYGTDALILGQDYTTSLNEHITVGSIKYIVSNISLTRADGTVYTYPKSKSYFIVSHSKRAPLGISLADIPVGDYTKINFGIGVDQAQFNLGAAGQGDFLAAAQAEEMLWSWSAGYKFIAYDGTYSSENVADALPFSIHTGKTSTDDNYGTVTLTLPQTLQVRKGQTPGIHLATDVSKIIDGATKINLTQIDDQGTGATIMGGAMAPVVTHNMEGAFSVSEVHNN